MRQGWYAAERQRENDDNIVLKVAAKAQRHLDKILKVYYQEHYHKHVVTIIVTPVNSAQDLKKT